MKPYLLAFIFSLGIVFTAQAQSNIEKTVTDATQAAGTIKGLFGKKKKDNTGTTSNAPETNNSTVTPQSKPGSKAQEVILAGKIAPDAKFIDCDEMQPFNQGAAIIKKGTSFALIDPEGNFIVPWNKYPSIATTSDIFNPNGIFIVRSTETNPKSYYMNNKGKILGPVDYYDFRIHVVVSTKFIIIYTGMMPNVTNTIIDKDGGKHVIHTSTAGYMNDSTFVYYEIGKDGYSIGGFKDINGNTLTKAIFSQIDPFYNGIAIVEVKNEFGQKRYGAINSKGRFTIAPTLIVPSISRFQSDIITVPGGANDDFDNEYLNIQTGKIIFKETKQTKERYGAFSITSGNYPSTFLSKENIIYIIDGDGNIVKDADILSKCGLKFGPSEKYSRGYYKYGFMTTPDIIAFTLELNVIGQYITDMCFYNLKTGKHFILQGNPDKPMMFDPVAHLTYASVPTYKTDNTGSQVNIEGYINADGMFKIVKGAGR